MSRRLVPQIKSQDVRGVINLQEFLIEGADILMGDKNNRKGRVLPNRFMTKDITGDPFDLKKVEGNFALEIPDH